MYVIEKYNRWTILKEVGIKNGINYILCKCDCGTEREVQEYNVINGYSKSCGCLKKEVNRDIILNINRTHGKSGTRLHNIWCNMKQRCFNKNASGYYNYGGKGVTVCEDWLNYESFENWALSNGYDDDLQIDRINVNGNYEPNNCRWVTKSFNISQSNKTCKTKSKSKFTKEDANKAKELREKGFTYKKIGESLGCGISHAKRLVDNEVLNLI